VSAGRAPVSAIVVSRNEAAELSRCLPALRFCDEIVVVDLESEDGTAAVAESHGARVLRRPPAESVERARADVAAEARHDWLLLTDPDEELPEPLARQVEELLATAPADVAVVYAPIRYRFGRRPLRGTVWGGDRERRLLVRRSGAELSPTIYAGTQLRPGFRSLSLPASDGNVIEHHWVSGYRDFLRKHRRYVRVSAVDRAAAGERTGRRAIAATPWRRFAESYVTRRGYRDGLTGLRRSALWAWYSTASELALARELRGRSSRVRASR
jgi:glycosyltransferase involved in cell wall biosynthesis